MTDFFRSPPATDKQLARLRELATWPGMPPEAETWTEEQISGGLTRVQAFDLLRKLGKRVADLNDGTQ